MGDKVDGHWLMIFAGEQRNMLNERSISIILIKAYMLDQEPLESGIIGVSRKAMEYMVMPLYKLSNNLRLFEDDGTSVNGFGSGRHDQMVLSVFAIFTWLNDLSARL